ncbi:MAG: DHH family phosphoesterase [Candidatus Woesearchaeota archaeon]
MALTTKQITEIKDELDTAYNPLFFYDDDPDGLASFLLLYRYIKEGHGVVVKAKPELDESFLRKVEEYKPDKIFLLDKPQVSQEFIDGAKTKIIWIDHHEPIPRHNVRHYNPMVNNKLDNRPVTYWCYRAVKQDLWIAAAGIVSDWFFLKPVQEFSKQYPDLLPPEVETAPQALYTTELGKLARILSFNLKGKTSDVNKQVKILTRIKTPYEILNQETAQGSYIYKQFGKIDLSYQLLLKESIHQAGNQKMLVYTYTDSHNSFTGDLSNELIYRFPKKIVVVSRSTNGEMKSSLRSGTVKLLPIVKKALIGVKGYGGGHAYACGAVVKIEDWQKFIDNINKQLKP